jgi:hypothetical protein
MKSNIIFIFACIAALSIILNFDVKNNPLLFIVCAILGMVLVTELIVFIGVFFNLSLGVILIYLMWFYAICLFFGFLKRKTSSVFK